MLRKTLTILSLIGLLLSVGLWGGGVPPPAWTKPHVLLGLSLI